MSPQTERTPEQRRSDWLEHCDLAGLCPDCGDPIPACWCPDLDTDTDFDTLETT